MKKILCTLISFAILVLSISISFPVFAEEFEMKQIENFSENGVELVRKYDEGKDFETVDEETDELDDLQFQTARLFVKCSSNFNKMGAEKVVSGFEDWHILQFSSPAEAKKAYLYYKEQEKIEAVEPDVALKVELEEADIFSESDENTNTGIMPAAAKDPVYITKEEFDNDYAKKTLGINEVLQFIKNHNIATSEIKVGVLDSGIDYNHELFDGKRLFRTYFNATNTGKKDDEFDNVSANVHGTGTTSCVYSTTPDSVQVGCYKTLNEKSEDYETEVSWLVNALTAAYSQGCSVINMSFSFSIDSTIIANLLEKLDTNGVQIFVSAGNQKYLIPYGNKTNLLCDNEHTVSVGASDAFSKLSSFSVSGHFVGFFAPGVDVAVATSNNRFRLNSGTSFSSPYAAGIFATLKSLNSGFSNEKIIDLMKYTCADVFAPFYHDEVWHGTERYGSGILDAWRAFCEMQKIPLVPDVEFSMPTGECNVGDKLALSCAEDCEIYYTTDLTVADKESGIRYTEPITITEDTVINAIAYDKNGNRGQNKFEYYIAFEMGNENDFVIDESGKIIGYKGEIRNLEIPEKVNGKTVTGFHYDLFSGDCECEGIIQPKNSVTGLKLPKTIEHLDTETYFTEDLEFFVAVGLKEILFAFSGSLVYVNLPNVEKVGDGAFWECASLREIYLPLCTEIRDMAFEATSSYHIYMPKLKYFYDGFLTNANITILHCPELENGFTEYDDMPRPLINVAFMCQLFLPKLKSVSSDGIYADSLNRVEFSEIESLMQLPRGDFKVTCSLVLPLSLKEIDFGNQYRNKKTYKFYGTKGSYAESWAKENNIEFIELNQETAVYTDVRETCNEYTKTLFFDSLGFHKSYQWYGSFDNSTENGIAIEGADKELIHLKDYREYPYYYCVCTSTDIGENTEHVEKIYSKVCRNTDYQSADYSAYDAAVLKANALEREYYKDLTALDAALAVDVSGLTVKDQAIVDAQTKAIEEALMALEFKDADYSAYNAAVEKANALDKSLYADTTELDKVLAEDISGLTILNQDIVDNQTRAIEDALKNLVLKGADYTEVEKAKSEIPEDLSVYTDASVSALQETLKAVDYSLNITEQATVDGYAEAITEAVNGLEYKPADYTEYNKAVEQANAIDRSLYKDLTVLDEALAVDVSGKNITEQATVDAQTKAILDALNSLVLKGADYTEVEKAKSEIPEDLSIYTDESVSALQEVLNAVDYSLNITEQATVDGYAEAITEAVNALEKNPVSPTVPEEPTKPNQTEPSVPDETTKPSTPEETTSGDIQKVDIPRTGGIAPVSCTIVLLTLLSACIYITTDRKRKNKK